MSLRKPPLDGIRVLDLTRVLAGPWCTQNLADLGAEVIKIERPGKGDDTRGWGPPYLTKPDGTVSQEAAYYLSTNRNKKSVCVDIATDEGAQAILNLARSCDVLVENFKAGGLRKYGLHYEALKAVNPSLVYCSITGFGHTGPYAEKMGYDLIIQGMGGLMSITGEKDDMPGGGPQKAGNAAADLMTGMYASLAVLSALFERSRSGQGQHIDIAMLDCQIAALGAQNLNYFLSGKVPEREGTGHQNLCPYQAFRVRDGSVIVAVGNDSQFQSLCRLLGRPDLARDERFLTNTGRVVHRKALLPTLEAEFLAFGRDQLLSRMERSGVPGGPINDISQVHEDPQVLAREIRFRMPHSHGGEVPMVKNPMRFSDSPVTYRKAPPLLGEHTEEIMAELSQ